MSQDTRTPSPAGPGPGPAPAPGPVSPQPGYPGPGYGAQQYAPPPADPRGFPAGQQHLPARSRRLWTTPVVAVVAGIALLLGALVGAGAATWGGRDAGPGSFQPDDRGSFPGGRLPGQQDGSGTSSEGTASGL
ncbi:hypothetical protein [Isoptericola sp. NPDC057653]|uniref:hypothetical protein n=1 Tax=unclassified Isoptericola TaxID=2623355 RepID=UPI00367DA9E4